ncbi:MAG: GNAT family N-acetyltransferase, partial [Firmicutes bacterium]|nr:GNAT family N-acetyltransferase [Bacillota bacterium]
SAVICDAAGAVIGVVDYRLGGESYLSLLLLDAEVQGRGVGRAAYTQLEVELRTAGCCRIRIDVVDEDADNVKPFWV